MSAAQTTAMLASLSTLAENSTDIKKMLEELVPYIKGCAQSLQTTAMSTLSRLDLERKVAVSRTDIATSREKHVPKPLADEKATIADAFIEVLGSLGKIYDRMPEVIETLATEFDGGLLVKSGDVTFSNLSLLGFGDTNVVDLDTEKQELVKLLVKVIPLIVNMSNTLQSNV